MHITIPQPDGSDLPIQTKEVTDASKMLGIHFATVGDGTTHIEQMRQKGLDWVDRVQTRPLPPRDAWLSFNLALQMGMQWGLVSVIMPPAKLEAMMGKLYYKCLPLLGVNRNITTLWRTLPEMFHGLGMPDFVILAFANKVFLLQQHWGFDGPAAELMTFAYKAFMLEVGLYGNIFSLSFKSYGCLATKGTWFHNFWELGDHLKVKVELNAKYHLQPVRGGEKSLMATFHNAGFTSEYQLTSLKVMKNYHCCVHLLDILCCDGKTVDEEVLTEEPGTSVLHHFPRERPTRADHCLWDGAI